MAHITLRITPDLLKQVEEFQRSRGIEDRSQAIRLAIREAMMDPAERGTVPERAELLRLLGESARGGSVTAMKALLEEYRRDGSDDTEGAESRSVIDELQAKRAARGT